MQNDAFGSCEEVEPRKTPKQASNFDSRPFPMVPEVSLVMDKPQQQEQLPRQISNTLSDTVPDSRSFNHDLSHQISDTYATWREKKFSYHPATAPSPIHNQIYSSTQNASGLQDNHNFRKSYNTVDPKHNVNSYNPDNQSQRSGINSQRFGPIEISNKYASNYLTSNDGMNRQISNIYKGENRTDLYSNRWSDERIWSNEKRQGDERRWSDEKRNLSDENRRYEHPRQSVGVYDVIQKLRQERSSMYPNTNSYTHKNAPVEYDHPPSHRPVQQSHNNQEHCHHQSTCCTSSHTNHANSASETETVRNLLQVITSQNEQIKGLQKQLDRMIKLHEQSLKNKNQCTCQSTMNHNEIMYQNSHVYDQTRNNNFHSIAHNNMMTENERCRSDLKLPDDRTKKTILEQKVSIGVMTSFELKVQNNPSTVPDNENKQKSSQEKIKPSIETSNILRNLVNDTGEMIKKKQNYFAPTPLGNISEGSESHMSSMRQSHLCSDSTRQSSEAHNVTEQLPNDQYSKRSSQDREIVPKNSESNKYQNRYEENVRYTPDLENDKRNEPICEQNKHDNREAAYQYEYQFENVRSSPQENFSRDNNADELNTEPLLPDITKMKHAKCDNFVDECLSLSESEFDVEDQGPPSPDPSIHLDMQEFSSDGGSLPPQQTTKVGWTIYNNVLDQVNQILQNSPSRENQDRESPDGYRNSDKREFDKQNLIDTVKAATLEQLTKLGISFSDNVDQRRPQGNKRVMFDESYYPTQGQRSPENHVAAKTSSFETNTSMHMKALARKYLNEEQLAEMAVQKTQTGAIRQTSSVQNTNMSFATMHYLQRYHLLPGNNSSPTKDDYKSGPVITERLAIRTAERIEPSSPRRYQGYAGASKGSFPSKILDISTLKQQPKLL